MMESPCREAIGRMTSNQVFHGTAMQQHSVCLKRGGTTGENAKVLFYRLKLCKILLLIRNYETIVLQRDV